ncbi:MAG: hypothetical protein ABFS30_08620 [Pseudomonadota bacterium]
MAGRHISERSVGLFILGVVAFSPPFLLIFNAKATLLGVPLLYIYLFTAWAVLIGLTWLVAERADPDSPSGAEAAHRPADPTDRRRG